MSLLQHDLKRVIVPVKVGAFGENIRRVICVAAGVNVYVEGVHTLLTEAVQLLAKECAKFLLAASLHIVRKAHVGQPYSLLYVEIHRRIAIFSRLHLRADALREHRLRRRSRLTGTKKKGSAKQSGKQFHKIISPKIICCKI